MKYTVDTEIGGITTTTKGVMAQQGDNISVISETTVEGITMKTRALILDNVMWLVDEAAGMIIKLVDTEPDDEITDYSGIERTGYGTGEVNGKNPV